MISSWQSYVDGQGDFELAKYLFQAVYGLMKQALDMGTLLSDDRNKLRAYKEQIKSQFKGQWFEIAEALEAFSLIVPCGCEQDEFCTECGGSRYQLSGVLSADLVRDIGIVVTQGDNPELQEKLRHGLDKAMEDVKNLPPPSTYEERLFRSFETRSDS